MNELESYILDFEALTGCKLVIHNNLTSFFKIRKQESEENLFDTCHQDLRKVFPCCKASGAVNECIQHCVHDLRHYAAEKKPQIVFSRCKYGFFKIAVPIYRNGTLVSILFGGIWKRPLDREKIRQLSSVLPLFAEGLASKAEEIKRSRSSSFERDVILFIESNCHQPLTVSALAKHLSLSVSRTCHLVQSTFGKSFSSLVTGERIRRAEILLERSRNLRIKEIALQCGYPNTEHFCRIFKKETGISPGTFRRKSLSVHQSS